MKWRRTSSFIYVWKMTRCGTGHWASFRPNEAVWQKCWMKAPDAIAGYYNMLKGIPRFYLLFFLFFLLSDSGYAKDYFYVKWVDDGDTIVLGDGRRVRYIGINAPEIAHGNQKAEPRAYAAKSFNKKLVLGKEIVLEFDSERNDHYGRILGYVFLKDGSLVNQMILAQGYAYCLYRSPNIKYTDVLLNAQRLAMQTNGGIWSSWKEKEGHYLGNKKSKRFHLPTCPLAKKIAPQNRICFRRKWDAFWEGYAPGKRCILSPARLSLEKIEY